MTDANVIISLEYAHEREMAPLLSAIRKGDYFAATAYGAIYKYRADADAITANGQGFIRACRANPAMPSGWECADIVFHV